jgi:hypothetical protein
MDGVLHDCLGAYFFFGPLFAIGGLGVALALLPPFLDI